MTKHILTREYPGPIPTSLKHLAPDNKYTEWVVNVRAQKHGLGTSFRVQVFLGDIDDADPDSWYVFFPPTHPSHPSL